MQLVTINCVNEKKAFNARVDNINHQKVRSII